MSQQSVSLRGRVSMRARIMRASSAWVPCAHTYTKCGHLGRTQYERASLPTCGSPFEFTLPHLEILLLQLGSIQPLFTSTGSCAHSTGPVQASTGLSTASCTHSVHTLCILCTVINRLPTDHSMPGAPSVSLPCVTTLFY